MISRTSGGYASHRERGPQDRRLRRFVTTLLLLIVGYFTIHTIFLQTIVQEAETMLPTLVPRDRLMMSPILYGPRVRAFNWILPGFSEPRRGDIVAIRPGFMDEPSAIRRLLNPVVRFGTGENARLDDGARWRSSHQIRRIIGLPGDTVKMERFVVYVRPADEHRFISETELTESPYATTVIGLPEGWRGDDPFGDAMDEMVLGPDEYFVIGDNRVLSLDSRHWGPITRDYIHGRIIFRYWPLRRAGSP